MPFVNMKVTANSKVTDRSTLIERIKICRTLIFIGYALFLLYFYSAWVDQGYGSQDIAILLVKVLPLLLFLPGLIRKNSKAHVWLGVVLLVYALKAIVDFVDEPFSFINMFQVGSLLLLFTSIILYLRWNGKLHKLEADEK